MSTAYYNFLEPDRSSPGFAKENLPVSRKDLQDRDLFWEGIEGLKGEELIDVCWEAQREGPLLTAPIPLGDAWKTRSLSVGLLGFDR